MGIFIGMPFDLGCRPFSGEVWSSLSEEPQNIKGYTSIVERLETQNKIVTTALNRTTIKG